MHSGSASPTGFAGVDVDSLAKRFAITLIKPSRYDNDGYVIQWRKSCVPSNSLGCLYGLTRDCAERHVLGPDVEITYKAYDEPNTIIPVNKLIADMRAAEGALLCLVGVQSNQFPRAMHIARRFREAGIPVAIGGFHVSGCLSMLKEIPADIQEAIDIGCIIFAGEAEEGRYEELLKAVWEKRADPVYNYMSALPDLTGAPTPFLPDYVLERIVGTYATFDSGRGCPYQCSFCSIINVQGRKSRWRSPDDVEATIRENFEARDQALPHHRRQLLAQQGLGTRPRPHDQDARRGGIEVQVLHPGRRAMPQDPRLHREVRASRLPLGLYRAGEHQPGKPDGRQEAAEQDLGVSQDAPGVEEARRPELRRLHHRLPA